MSVKTQTKSKTKENLENGLRDVYHPKGTWGRSVHSLLSPFAQLETINLCLTTEQVLRFRFLEISTQSLLSFFYLKYNKNRQ